MFRVSVFSYSRTIWRPGANGFYKQMKFGRLLRIKSYLDTIGNNAETIKRFQEDFLQTHYLQEEPSALCIIEIKKYQLLRYLDCYKEKSGNIGRMRIVFMMSAI